MNAVGIDVSKGKSTVAIFRSFGEVVASPFEVNHVSSELNKLAEMLRGLDGETKIVMECTGSYHLHIAYVLYEQDFFVSAVNPIITHNYDNNSIRKSRNDKSDAIKIANYAISNWLSLPQYVPEEDVRHMLKAYSRQLRTRRTRAARL